jgi:hypothetical protein
LAFFGERARWAAKVWEDPRTPLSADLGWPSSACVRVGFLLSGKTPEPPFSAALGLAAAHGFPLRVGVLCCVVVELKPRTAFLRCDRPGRCARLGLLWRACDVDCRSRGRPAKPSSSLRLAQLTPAAALGFCGRQQKEMYAHVRRKFDAMSCQRRWCCHGAGTSP